MNIRQQVLSGLRWSAGARFSAQCITWIITILVMRLLNPNDYGLVAMSGTFIFFVSLLNELGLGAALIQKQDIAEDTLEQVSGLLLFINFCCFLLLLFCAPLIAAFFEEPRITAIIRVSSLQFILTGFAIVPQSLVLKRMEFKKLSIMDFASNIAGSIVTFSLALNGKGVWSLVWGNLAIVTCRTVGINIIRPFIHIPRFPSRNLGNIISFGGYVTLNRILWFFYTQADVFIIGKLLGKETLGLYGVGNQLASLPMAKVSGILNLVAFPAFSSIKNDAQLVESHLLKALRMVSFFAFPVLWGLSSIAPEMIAVLLGDKWKLATLPLQLLTFTVPFRMIINILDPAITGMGQPKISATVLLFSAATLSLAILIGTRWGLTGVCLGIIAVFPLIFLYSLVHMLPFLNTTVRKVLLAISNPGMAAFIMYFAVVVTRIALPSRTNPVLKLIILIGIGAITYFGLIVRLHKVGYQEIVALMKT